jgi:group I intron endonuclease
MIIYCIRNKVNGKCYIGQSSLYNSNEDFQKSNYWGSGTYIQRAIKKYGIENFEKMVLIHCKNEQADFYEILWIRKLKTKVPNGYNLTNGGDGVKKGYKHTTESKNRLKKTKESIEKFRQWAIEYYKTHSGFMKNKHHTKKAKRRMSEAAKNRLPHTEETKKLIGVGAQRKHTMNQNEKNRVSGIKSWEKRRIEGKDNKSPKTEEHKQKLRRPKSEEGRKNIKIAAQTRKNCKKICKQCNVEFESKGYRTLLCNDCKKNYTYKHLTKG